MEDYQKNYEEFWKELVEDESGNLDKDKVMRELSDYLYVMRGASKVYDHVTGSRISKPNTDPDAVKSVADEYYAELYGDADKMRDALELALEVIDELHWPDTVKEIKEALSY